MNIYFTLNFKPLHALDRIIVMMNFVHFVNVQENEAHLWSLIAWLFQTQICVILNKLLDLLFTKEKINISHSATTFLSESYFVEIQLTNILQSYNFYNNIHCS